MKKRFGAVTLLSLLLACTTTPSGASVESPDAWAEAQALWEGPSTGVAVLGFESAPAEPLAAPSVTEAWVFEEGHVTIVGFSEAD
jgi:hypothetical protein